MPPAAYTRKESEQVYEELVARAIAKDLGTPFSGVWLEAPEHVMTGRLAARRDDASDATPEVVRRQLEADLADVSWHRLDAFASREVVVAATERLLSGQADPCPAPPETRVTNFRL